MKFLNNLACSLGIWGLAALAVMAAVGCFTVYAVEKIFYGVGRFFFLPLTEAIRDAAHWLQARMR